MSELVYAGKSLKEIARLDDYQTHWILFRRRDKYGRLVRDNGLPEGVLVDDDGMRRVGKPVPFAVMFGQVKKRQGVTREEATAQWHEYLKANPKLGIAGD